MSLPPYIPNQDRDLLAKCARLKREIQAAARGGGAANDNEPVRRKFYWEED